MILYRLAVQRLIVYFQLDKLSEEQERLNLLLHRKPKEVYKTKLKTNKTLNLYISILLSTVVFLLCISIPFHAVESPCDVLKEKGYHTTYHIARFIQQYTDILDYFIIVFFIMLVYVSIKTILDAIANTKINMSPWLEQGKYTLPPRRRRSYIINTQ